MTLDWTQKAAKAFDLLAPEKQRQIQRALTHLAGASDAPLGGREGHLYKMRSSAELFALRCSHRIRVMLQATPAGFTITDVTDRGKKDYYRR